MIRSAIAVLFAIAGVAAPVSALCQEVIGRDHYGGLHWAVAAPEGARWRLECRFRPVIMEVSAYDRRHWANGMTWEGQGPQQGRLPGDNGRCTLIKTGGPGSVGLAIIKDGTSQSAGTIDPARPARVSVF